MRFILVLLGILLPFRLISAHHRNSCCPKFCQTIQNITNTNVMLIKLVPQRMKDDLVSLAQWNFREDSKPERLPPVIKQAVCLGCKENGTDIRGLHAVPIQYTIQVLYKKTCQGKQIICRCPETVNVSCTCVRNKQHSGKICLSK
ncbi:hypothetical protein DPEC_G00015950 [Dallia pectoralis]|uniref:Uncharacterized protein n=1 Tax=Dallia pectoralis TaxID=75939 RepID=A0ACC2HP56_DALPE|nr:hypothetical protein DPEC_G00015950 [Dallia pectoralis]